MGYLYPVYLRGSDNVLWSTNLDMRGVTVESLAEFEAQESGSLVPLAAREPDSRTPVHPETSKK